MKAIVIDKYGGTEQLQYRDCELPTPASDQVLLRVMAASVNPVDWKIRSGAIRLFYPADLPNAPLGYDVAGTIEAMGDAVSGWNPGDAVYTRLNTGKMGSYAEFCTVEASILAPKPTNMSFEEAAAVPLAALTALQAMRDLGGLATGQRVLINGASGGVGTYAVQIAKAIGAQVTAVCSQGNHALATELGADRVIDYRQEDFTTLGDAYHVVFDAVANRSFGDCRKILEPNGAYVTTVPSLSFAFWVVASRLTTQRPYLIRVVPRAEDLRLLTKWSEAGWLKPVIDSTFDLADTAAAHLRSESGRARGKIVLRVRADEASVLKSPVQEEP